MNLEKLRDHIIDIVEDLQYKVYLGTMSRYNKRPEITDREIIIEPINLPLQNTNSCNVNITLNLWIAIRRRIDERSNNTDEGDDAEWIDYMISEAKQLYNVLNQSKYIRIMIPENSVVTNYYEAENNISVNYQSLVRMSLPIKLYNINE